MSNIHVFKPQRPIPFRIMAEKNNGTAEIRIIGTIGWEANSEEFRRQVDALVSEGVQNVHIYINSSGGSCFDAAEIVNILSNFKGTITGEGGALVASAATFIALHCKTFTMPENGLFMVHKPTLTVEGTEAQIEQTLKMLRKVQEQYYNAYKAVATDPAEFEKMWHSGDYWMTAEEAEKAGFITGATTKITLDKASRAMVAACAYSVSSDTDFKARVIDTLGLEESATDDDIIDRINELLNDAESVEAAVSSGLIDSAQAVNFAAMAKADPAAFRNYLAGVKDAQRIQMDSVIANAVSVGKIISQEAPIYRVIGEKAGIVNLEKLIGTLPGAARPIDFINSAKGDRSKWGLNEYRKYAPEELRSNPGLYAQLVAREGRTMELTHDTLEYYRKHNPEYLEAQPEEYNKLLTNK